MKSYVKHWEIKLGRICQRQSCRYFLFVCFACNSGVKTNRTLKWRGACNDNKLKNILTHPLHPSIHFLPLFRVRVTVAALSRSTPGSPSWTCFENLQTKQQQLTSNPEGAIDCFPAENNGPC